MADSPPRAKASDFAPEVLVLFDQYVHGLIDRRAFLNGAARHASAGVSALGLLTALSPDFAYAQKVAPADPRITASRSEEHTSELQSLMRISYAVFCLKKKSQTPIQRQHNHNR